MSMERLEKNLCPRFLSQTLRPNALNEFDEMCVFNNIKVIPVIQLSTQFPPFPLAHHDPETGQAAIA